MIYAITDFDIYLKGLEDCIIIHPFFKPISQVWITGGWYLPEVTG